MKRLTIILIHLAAFLHVTMAWGMFDLSGHKDQQYKFKSLNYNDSQNVNRPVTIHRLNRMLNERNARDNYVRGELKKFLPTVGNGTLTVDNLRVLIKDIPFGDSSTVSRLTLEKYESALKHADDTFKFKSVSGMSFRPLTALWANGKRGPIDVNKMSGILNPTNDHERRLQTGLQIYLHLNGLPLDVSLNDFISEVKKHNIRYLSQAVIDDFANGQLAKKWGQISQQLATVTHPPSTPSGACPLVSKAKIATPQPLPQPPVAQLLPPVNLTSADPATHPYLTDVPHSSKLQPLISLVNSDSMTTNNNAAMISALSTAFPQIGKLFNMTNKSWLHDTIGSHSKDVMDGITTGAAAFGLDKLSPNSKVGNWAGLFRLTMALHDTGKPLGPNHLQKKFTGPIVDHVAHHMGLNPTEKAIMDNIIHQDVLGKLVMTKSSNPSDTTISAQSVYNKIEKDAKALGMNPRDLFRLKRSFYINDAGYYSNIKAKFKQEGGRMVPNHNSAVYGEWKSLEMLFQKSGYP